MSVSLIGIGLGAWFERRERRKLRSTVFGSLDNAWSGGCFNAAEAGYLHEMTAREIAADMELYCEDVSGYDQNELLPYVEQWLYAKGLT